VWWGDGETGDCEDWDGFLQEIWRFLLWIGIARWGRELRLFRHSKPTAGDPCFVTFPSVVKNLYKELKLIVKVLEGETPFNLILLVSYLYAYH
jgi:hypothetical protein